MYSLLLLLCPSWFFRFRIPIGLIVWANRESLASIFRKFLGLATESMRIQTAHDDKKKKIQKFNPGKIRTKPFDTKTKPHSSLGKKTTQENIIQHRCTYLTFVATQKSPPGIQISPWSSLNHSYATWTYPTLSPWKLDLRGHFFTTAWLSSTQVAATAEERWVFIFHVPDFMVSKDKKIARNWGFRVF